ncbi:MAG: hypothetical protein FWD42_10470, partial [Solirubrobacterales bacterium]|nr:hypothetical protein [Solirubrobacterales bacterium]
RFREDVRSHIAITELLGRTPLRVEALARAAQCSEGEALEVLERLATAGAVERLLNRSRSARLTRQARSALDSRITYRQRSTLDEQWDVVHAFFDVEEEIGRPDLVELLGLNDSRATEVLGELKRQRRIEPVGSGRGRGVRYRLIR